MSLTQLQFWMKMEKWPLPAFVYVRLMSQANVVGKANMECYYENFKHYNIPQIAQKRPQNRLLQFLQHVVAQSVKNRLQPYLYAIKYKEISMIFFEKLFGKWEEIVRLAKKLIVG